MSDYVPGAPQQGAPRPQGVPGPQGVPDQWQYQQQRPNPQGAPAPGAPVPPPPAATQDSADWGRIGGGLLAFIILQAVQTFALLSDFPSTLEDALESVVSRSLGFFGLARAASEWIALATLVIYAAVIIVTMVQLVQRHPAFLRNFQIAGIIAIVGNLAVFLVMEAVHVYYSTSLDVVGYEPSYGYSWEAGSHWTLVVLALMWTIFWTLYFARSVRMRHYMSPDNPYTTANGLPYVEQALFGKGMRG